MALLPVAEALARVLDGVSPLPPEQVAVTDAHGRVLAADPGERFEVPTFPQMLEMHDKNKNGTLELDEMPEGPFKQHFVVDLDRGPEEFAHPHHRRNARKALRELRVEECPAPADFLDDWVALYEVLVRRHGIRGVAAWQGLAQRKYGVPDRPEQRRRGRPAPGRKWRSCA